MAEKIVKASGGSGNMPGMGMGGTEKSKNMRKAYANFLMYIGAYKWKLATWHSTQFVATQWMLLITY